MSIKRFCKWTAAAMSLAVALLTGACSSAPSADELLESIPDNSVCVIKLNIKSLLDNAGIEQKGGKYVLSGDLDSFFDSNLTSSQREKLDQMLLAIPAVHDENVMFFVTADDELAVTAGLKSTDVVEAALRKEFGAPEKSDGYTVYDVDRTTDIIIRDKQIWITPNAKDLRRAVERAADKPFGAYAGPAGYLTADHTFAGVVNLRAVKKVSRADWPDALDTYAEDFLTFDADLDGLTSTGNMSLMDADGKCTFPTDLFGKIDTSFLKLIPANASYVTAVGKPTAKLLGLIDMATRYTRDREVARYVDSLDGTTAIAAILPGNINDIDKTNFIALTHMPADNVNSLADLVAGSIGVEPNPARQYNFTSPSHSLSALGFKEIYWGNYDGYFAIGTTALGTGHTNSFADKFEGRYAASFVDMPRTAPIMQELDMPFGFTTMSYCGDDGIHSTFKLTDTEGKILANFIRLAADSRWQRKVMGLLMGGYVPNHYVDTADDIDYDDFEVIEEVEI